ncbi:MAG: hypothetical protein K2I18_08700 [Paramuribaculum sp.]|nr:hypothetical protein [Paramuribaculum sp.]
MKKIMFSDKFGLTEAVLSGRKTQTRRIITCPKEFKGEWVAGFHVYRRQSDNAILEYPCMYDADERDFDGGQILPKYKVGEVVAVAQSYKDIGLAAEAPLMEANGIGGYVKTELSPGWTNKMFARADLMLHQIRITDVRVERLQDISYEDCMAEGVCKWTKDRELFKYDMADGFEMFEWRDMPRTPREAYAALIDRISGKGTWKSNPYVFVYDFELVK